jgi:thiamine-phosphate pyrophosphorylase
MAMRRRQPAATAWLMTDVRNGRDPQAQLSRLPRGHGVVFRHHELAAVERRDLLRKARRLAAARALVLIDDAEGRVARVHSARELRRALLRKPELLFLSPMFQTRTHPDWTPLPRMRAAALARLAGRRGLALGGMNRRRFAHIRALGFTGWGGIDAFG